MQRCHVNTNNEIYWWNKGWDDGKAWNLKDFSALDPEDKDSPKLARAYQEGYDAARRDIES